MILFEDAFPSLKSEFDLTSDEIFFLRSLYYHAMSTDTGYVLVDAILSEHNIVRVAGEKIILYELVLRNFCSFYTSGDNRFISINFIYNENKYEFKRHDFMSGRYEKADKVYIMHDPSSGCHKIGTSVNPILRENTLSAVTPRIKTIRVWVAPKSIEKVLHDLYKKQRVRGEWFDLNEDMIHEIDKTMKVFPRLQFTESKYQ